MTAFDLDELEQAFALHCEAIDEMCQSGDWSAYADEYTEDVDYIEHAYGTLHGREAVRQWVTTTMSEFPGRIMTGFPVAWKVVDPAGGRIVCEIRNPMPDPGDGTVFDEPNITILDYAGDGLWSRQEDVYNPLRFLAMAKQWCAIAENHGRLPEDAAGFV